MPFLRTMRAALRASAGLPKAVRGPVRSSRREPEPAVLARTRSARKSFNSECSRTYSVFLHSARALVPDRTPKPHTASSSWVRSRLRPRRTQSRAPGRPGRSSSGAPPADAWRGKTNDARARWHALATRGSWLCAVLAYRQVIDDLGDARRRPRGPHREAVVVPRVDLAA